MAPTTCKSATRRVKAAKPAEGLIAFARREGITHVVFGQSQRSRWQILWQGSVIDRFLTEVPDGMKLTAYDADFDKQMQAAEKCIRKYRNALRELAK